MSKQSDSLQNREEKFKSFDIAVRSTQLRSSRDRIDFRKCNDDVGRGYDCGVRCCGSNKDVYFPARQEVEKQKNQLQ